MNVRTSYTFELKRLKQKSISNMVVLNKNYVTTYNTLVDIKVKDSLFAFNSFDILYVCLHNFTTKKHFKGQSHVG